MANDDEVKRNRPGKQGGQEKVNLPEDDKPGNRQMAGEGKRFAEENAEENNAQQGGMQAGRGGRKGQKKETSGAGQKGNEKAGQRQIGKERGDTEDEEGDGEQKGESEDDESYDESELRPGGSGKQGDQQQFTQEREQRKDKSRNSGDSDKLHGP